MELILAIQSQDKTQIRVTCDGQFSHLFGLYPLKLAWGEEQKRLITDSVGYGRAIYTALFAPGSRAQQALEEAPERIVLIAMDEDIDAIPWEYAYGPDGFLVLECHFVRGLPVQQQGPPPTLDTGLHIVALPSNPLSRLVEPLDIDTEWLNLREGIASLPSALTLERIRPPTIKQLRNAVAGQRQRVVHFMGHGGQLNDGAMLCFEKDDGDLDLVKAKEMALRLRGTTFLVMLNACISASPGSTMFSNLAAVLVRQRIPYALGMRLSIYDDDARLFASAFYNDLARGTPVEEALLQARLTLASQRKRSWVIGVPVLYTSLAAPSAGFVCKEGKPVVLEWQPAMEVSMLPRADGVFQGRVEDLRQLGGLLTGDGRPRIVTIHGGGGQGKTALARETVERFAWAWPDGVWSTTLENLPDHALFTAQLARFLGLNPQEIIDPNEVERLLLAQLATKRVLIVLDNAETLVHAVEANNAEAQSLAQLLQQLPSSSVSLLVTSRVLLGWSGEVEHELDGLTVEEGAHLFKQSSPQRREAIEQSLAQELSHKVEGHPLSLRLLGGAFNFSAISLAAFVKQCEEQLIKAENKYLGQEHRHRKLYASIETSVRYLNSDLLDLLSGLWVFHAPFQPQAAVAIFDPEAEDTEETPSVLHSHLYNLRLRGLLTPRHVITFDGTLDLFYVLPTTRPYIEQHMQSAYGREDVFDRFGKAYAGLVHYVYDHIDYTPLAVVLVEQCEVDLERGMAYVTGIEQASYKIDWAWILHRLGGRPQRSLRLFEEALDEVQGHEQDLTFRALNDMAVVYNDIGERKRALEVHEESLPLRRALGDREGEAVTLSNMADVYSNIGEVKRALELYEEALPIRRALGDRAGEATTLNNMALVYSNIGEVKRALELYEEALTIGRAVGDRVGEATTLSNMAGVYNMTGEVKRALGLYKEALTITQAVGDRAGEANTLNSMASVYSDIGEVKRALELYEEALPITRVVGDRAEEASILNNMASVYSDTGEVKRALELYEEVLPIRRVVGDRTGEATTLNNMAGVYSNIGEVKRALELYEEVLPIRRAVGDRAGEATTLNDIALVYSDRGEIKRALELYEEALPITRVVGDRAGEATTLTNMAGVYSKTGEVKRALELYEEALLIMRTVGDRAGEAATLSNMAGMYSDTGEVKRALELYEEALPIRRAVGDRAGEASTLNNMALVYSRTREVKRALELYEEALPIIKAVGDRAREATTLSNMAIVYSDRGDAKRALELYEEALPIRRAVGDRAEEAATLTNMAVLFYQQLKRTKDAITSIERAIEVLEQTGLPQDAAGQTLEQLYSLLQAMRGEMPLNMQNAVKTLSEDVIQAIIANTISVMTHVPEWRDEWRAVLENALQDAQRQGPNWQIVTEFHIALLALLNGQVPVLPADHPYAHTLINIQKGIAAGGLLEEGEEDDEAEEEYLFDLLIANTLAVLGPTKERLHEWREELVQVRNLCK